MPDIATQVNGYEVMQKQVGDCSVLSSLAVAAHFEMKHQWKKRIITHNIFPQDQSGNPVYNPTGEYIVKLYVNGAWRGVVIDDYMPINTAGNWLCAYSARGKMWVSLIEKAYLKLNGGYDFNGSNSSRDLYILTGWLPQKYDLNKEDLDRNMLWNKIKAGYANNDCLITLGTGVIPDEDNVGLVGNHAYGVLEIIEAGGHRVMLLKNPWGHFRWNGKFSYGDATTWTPQLKQQLGYQNFSEDKGVFWIDFDSVLTWFDSLDINWNPDLLTYRKSFYDIWKSNDMLQSSSLSLKENPQYCIDFMADAQQVASAGESFVCWVVVSKL